MKQLLLLISLTTLMIMSCRDDDTIDPNLHEFSGHIAEETTLLPVSDARIAIYFYSIGFSGPVDSVKTTSDQNGNYFGMVKNAQELTSCQVLVTKDLKLQVQRPFIDIDLLNNPIIDTTIISNLSWVTINVQNEIINDNINHIVLPRCWPFYAGPAVSCFNASLDILGNESSQSETFRCIFESAEHEIFTGTYLIDSTDVCPAFFSDQNEFNYIAQITDTLEIELIKNDTITINLEL